MVALYNEPGMAKGEDHGKQEKIRPEFSSDRRIYGRSPLALSEGQFDGGHGNDVSDSDSLADFDGIASDPVSGIDRLGADSHYPRDTAALQTDSGRAEHGDRRLFSTVLPPALRAVSSPRCMYFANRELD